jgi:ribosomal protein L11 methyltransferase
MEWLEQHVQAGCSVLDYGCGSGILAILARKLGAMNVDGIDIDPQAINAARDNAERNQCADINWFIPADFALAREGARYDIVAANILSGPLKLMAPMLASRVAPGGAMVLSGILARQTDELIASYAPYITLAVAAEREGWIALAGRKEH